MEPIQRVQDFERLKTLADPRRLAILRLLMAKPANLTGLGQILDEHPARVRHHLKQLESAGLVELDSTRVVRGFVEKYYRAKARAFYLQELITPDTGARKSLVVLGSHDLALELLNERLPSVDILTYPVGSLDGLLALRQGTAHIAGCHLLDAQSGEYNLPFVRHIFPDRVVNLVTLAHRLQGLIIQPGNPRQIHSLEDLLQKDVSFVNRNRGSGTRVWLDRRLDALNLPHERIVGYKNEVYTHTRVGEMVANGKANVGLGIQAVAQQYELDFVPLFQERYDLAIPVENLADRNIQPLLDYLQSGDYRRTVLPLAGYETEHSGELLVP